jgi:ankyrin repeat protein
MVALLLEHDANPNISDETGTTALHIAAARGAINIVVRLIDAHADVNAQNNTGVRPLHHGASQRIRTR